MVLGQTTQVKCLGKVITSGPGNCLNAQMLPLCSHHLQKAEDEHLDIHLLCPGSKQSFPFLRKPDTSCLWAKPVAPSQVEMGDLPRRHPFRKQYFE